ncbi:hypothetical protein [Micromonospora auratinigra]|uniref:Uncharacterized protein n=1 Tax=Micromonospora auratinigra TaxID=261654 RepID=A0A1A8Z9G1_9ACTN|nr:hypothetical protein [Micromonospora auratinigra]SBT40472.1 hypothetical protein GA0070611_1274 [Micromonospora auratinigra]
MKAKRHWWHVLRRAGLDAAVAQQSVRPRRPRWRVRLAAATALVAVVGLAAVPAPAGAALPNPDFGASIDPYAAYDGQDTCDQSAKPGPVAVRDMLTAEYGKHNSGIGRDCSIGGPSEHKEGRALDYHFDYNDIDDRARAKDFLDWLLATDRYGNKHANARRLGVMYVIWNRQWWRSYHSDWGWQDYTGESAHTDHIHISFSWDGAYQRTSWWTKAPTPPAPPAEPVTAVSNAGMALNGLFHVVALGGPKGMLHHVYDPDTGWLPVRDVLSPIASKPSVVPFGGNMTIFARGTDDLVKYRSLTPNGWDDGWKELPGRIDGAPATAVVDSRLWVVARSGGKVSYRFLGDTGWNSDGVWRSLDQPNKDVSILSDPVATVFKNRLYVVARGSDSRLWVRMFNPAVSTWTDWFVLPGLVSGTPAAAARGNTLLVFAATSSGAVRYHAYTDGAPSWDTDKALGGAVSGNLTAVRSTGDVLYVFGRTAAGDLVYRFLDDSGWNDDATTWRTAGRPSGVTLDSTPLAIPYGATLFVGARGNDADLHARSLGSGGWGSWVTLDGYHAPIS